MDPLRVLPKELVLRLCSMLAPEDLVSVGQLDKDWRNLCRDPELWKNVELSPEICGLRHAKRVLRSAPRLRSVVVDTAEVVEELLQTSATVTTIGFFDFNDDPASMMKVIAKFAESLEDLGIGNVTSKLMDFLMDTPLPKLRYLVLSGTIEDTLNEDSVLEYSGRWADRGPSHSTLQELMLRSMDELVGAVRSLILAHRYTLSSMEIGYINGELVPEVLDAVARCSALTHLSLFWTEDLAVLCGKLPALRFLELEYPVLDDLVGDLEPGSEEVDLLPVGLITGVEEMSLELTRVDVHMVVNALVRRAPHLSALRKLTVSMMAVDGALTVEKEVGAALPHVNVVVDAMDDCDTDDEVEEET